MVSYRFRYGRLDGLRVDESKLRKIEVLKNGEWVVVGHSDVKSGDSFRMFDSDGTAAFDGEIFIAKTDSFMNEAGEWGCAVE